MRADLLARFRDESYPPAQLRFECTAEVRYRGQASRLRVSVGEGAAAVEQLCREFEKEHLRLYGQRPETGSSIEVVAVRMVGRAPPPEVDLPRAVDRAQAPRSHRRAFFGAAWGTREVSVVSRQALTDPIKGPLLIDEYDATIVVPPDFRVWLDEAGNVVMEANDAAPN